MFFRFLEFIILSWQFPVCAYNLIQHSLADCFITQRTKGFATTWAEGLTPIAVLYAKDIMIGRLAKNIDVQTEFKIAKLVKFWPVASSQTAG